MHKLEKKIEKIKDIILTSRHVTIAFNGGVGSSILLKLANSLLGEKCVAITVKSFFIPQYELEEMKKITKELGVKHIIKNLSTKSFNQIIENEEDKCYLCKKLVLDLIKKESYKLGINQVLDGTKYSDHKGLYRILQANSDHEIVTPFIDMQLTDEDLFHMAHVLDIHVEEGYKKVCLSHTLIGKTTKKRLQMLEQGNELLTKLGIHNSDLSLDNDIGNLFVNHRDITGLVINSKKIKNLFRRYGFKELKIELEK